MWLLLVWLLLVWLLLMWLMFERFFVVGVVIGVVVVVVDVAGVVILSTKFETLIK